MIHLVWFSVCSWIRSWIAIYRYGTIRPQSTHSIDIIGDSLAKGKGDYVTMQMSHVGLSSRIETFARRSKRLRNYWHLVNANFPDSKSWAEVSVVAIGLDDQLSGVDIYTTKAHVQDTVKLLLQKPGVVYVCTFPICWDVAVEPRTGWMVESRARNELIALSCQEIESDRVILVRLDVPELGRREDFSYDGIHLNSGGYDRAAKMLWGANFESEMLKNEWVEIKARLNQ